MRRFALLLLVSLAGCHPTAATTPPPPLCSRVALSTPPAAPDLSSAASACASIVDAFNRRYAECGIEDSSFDLRGICFGVDMLAQAGTITYDASAAATAIANIASAGCDLGPVFEGGYAFVLTSIRSAIKGTIANQQSCVSSFECDHGTCFTMFGCPGQCEPIGSAMLGDSCGPGCNEDLGIFCDVVKDKCVTPPGVGEPCANTGSDRNEYLQCAPGAHCGADNLCHARARVGQACTPSTTGAAVQDCAYCATCLGGTCHANLRQDDPCTSDDECMPGLLCQQQRCQPYLAKLGELCGNVPARTRPITCDPAQGVCTSSTSGSGCNPSSGCGVCAVQSPPPPVPMCF